jgi:hypothetical protein
VFSGYHRSLGIHVFVQKMFSVVTLSLVSSMLSKTACLLHIWCSYMCFSESSRVPAMGWLIVYPCVKIKSQAASDGAK